VSPHNVILGYDGTVKLLDFGVAMSAVTEHAETMIAGKWAYMSPEHTANQSVDHRSDLFSLGVMMYLLCTGSMPFGGTEPREIVKKIRAGAYKPLREAAPHVPEPIANLVARMLASRPEDRPQTGGEVVSELMEIARTNRLESSGTNLAALIAQLFANEQETIQIKEMPRPSSDDISAAKRLAAGSNQAQTTVDPDSGKAFGQAGSNSASFGRATPTGAGIGVDASVSIARRSQEFSSKNPVPDLQSRLTPVPSATPQLKQGPKVIRVILIAGMIIAFAIAMYIFVGPA
jgi:serine/threonine protein kinase